MKEKYNQLSDEQMLHMIQAGDEEALEALFEKYYDTLVEVSLYFLKNVQLAEEAVADVFVKLWANRQTLTIRQKLKSYFLVAVKNQSLNLLQKEARHRSYEDYTQAYPVEEGVEKSLYYEDLFHKVDQLISQMPPKRQLIFRLNRLDGLPYKEIAELLNISVETVQKHMTLAVKHMNGYKAHLSSLVHYLSATTTLLLSLQL